MVEQGSSLKINESVNLSTQSIMVNKNHVKPVQITEVLMSKTSTLKKLGQVHSSSVLNSLSAPLRVYAAPPRATGNPSS